jgi:hypothetical protein
VNIQRVSAFALMFGSPSILALFLRPVCASDPMPFSQPLRDWFRGQSLKHPRESGWRPLASSPVVRIFLVAEVPDPGDEWLIAFLAGPGDGLALVLERGQHMVGMVFDDVIVDRATRLALGLDAQAAPALLIGGNA